MKPTQDPQKTDPVGFVLVLAMAFAGVACPISLIVVEDQKESVLIASVLGGIFVGIALLLYIVGRVKKSRSEMPPAWASLALAFIWAICTVVSIAFLILFARSLRVLPAVSFALGSLGFFASARSNFLTYRERSRAIQRATDNDRAAPHRV